MMAASGRQMGGAEAFDLFCSPSLSLKRAPNHDELVDRARHHLRETERLKLSTSVGNVQTYRFRPDRACKANVLIVHGWSGEAAFMGAFGEYLRRRGYSAVLMDMPAHGESDGERVSLFDCAQAIAEVAQAIGPFPLALGHSVGGMALLLAVEGHVPLDRSYAFEAYGLISMPNAFAEVTRTFGEELGLSPEVLSDFERRLEILAGRSIAQFSGANLLTAINRPALLLHCRDDTKVPFRCSETTARCSSNVELAAFSNLGHRAILYAPQAIRAATAYFDRILANDTVAQHGRSRWG